MFLIKHRLEVIRSRIITVAKTVGRDPKEIRLLAVSKNFNFSYILEAVQAGQLDFGENYVKEAINKITIVKKTIPQIKITWHFIGSIQSNKTREIANNFDWVHSVDSEKIINRLAEQRPLHLPPLNICLQVNISAENNKSGLDPVYVFQMAHIVSTLPRLCFRGLMAIPEKTLVQDKQHTAFRALQILLIKLNQQGIMCDTLSIGMSADMDAAISEGATIVRIGKAIFG